MSVAHNRILPRETFNGFRPQGGGLPETCPHG